MGDFYKNAIWKKKKWKDMTSDELDIAIKQLDEYDKKINAHMKKWNMLDEDAVDKIKKNIKKKIKKKIKKSE